jgi:hypothetical protein
MELRKKTLPWAFRKKPQKTEVHSAEVHPLFVRMCEAARQKA